MKTPAPAGKRSSWGVSLKPHHQVVVIALAAVVFLSALGIVTSTRLSRIDKPIRRVSATSTVSETLTTAENLYLADINETTQLITTTTPAERASVITDLSAKARSADNAWQTYKRIGLGVPGEASLQQTVENAEARQIELVTPALAGRALSPVAVEALAKEGSTMIGAIDVLRALYLEEHTTASARASTTVDHARRDLLILLVAALLVLIVVSSLVFTSVRRHDRDVRRREVQRAIDADRNDLETRLARSLEMVHAEEATFPRVERALAEVAGTRTAEVLIADSSRSHVHQVVALAGALDGGGCPVGTLHDCPAIGRGQTQLFADSRALDACPYLADRSTGPCSAVCVPLSIAGSTLGVAHLTDAPGSVPDAETAVRLEIIARKAGERIGTLRSFVQSETEAHTDQLTGLLNRRSLDDEVQRITEAGRAYTVAYGDLDHFKVVNDTYGHDAGDRALRLFARVLRDSVRPRDIPARYGGEEFVVVLPDCSVDDAAQVLERLRENLARAQAASASPPVTVSFGIADSKAGDTFDATLNMADRALARAKSQGRDRVLTSTERADPEFDVSPNPV